MKKRAGISSIFGRHWHDFKAAYNSLLSVNFLNSILIVAVIAVSLLIPIIFYVLIQNVTVYADNINMGRNITVYLQDDVSAERASVIRDEFARDPRIKDVELVTADEAIKGFSQALGMASSDMLEMDENPLPNVIIVTPQTEFTTPEALEKITTEISGNEEVALVQMDKQWFNRLHSIILFLNAFTLVIAVILLISVVLVVISSISSRVAMHYNEIEVMKLVGATNGYICRPYFYLGVWLGLLGSMVAVWLSSLAVMLSDKLVNGIAESYGTHVELLGLSLGEVLTVILGASFFGAIISSICAYVNIARIEPSE